MIYAFIQLLTVAFCLVAHRSIRKHAVWYYAACVAVVALFFYGALFELPEVLWRPLYHLIQQCMWGMAFFVVVMFVGALPRSSKVAQNLRSIRSELSIIAFILCLGHLIYLNVVPRLLSIALELGFVMPATAAGLVVSIALLVLLLVLGITSFKFVKKHMSARGWKALQRWAYPFYALVYVHLMLMLAPSLSQGSTAKILTAAVYTLIFGAYAVLRVRRAVLDRGNRQPCEGNAVEAGAIPAASTASA